MATGLVSDSGDDSHRCAEASSSYHPACHKTSTDLFLRRGVSYQALRTGLCIAAPFRKAVANAKRCQSSTLSETTPVTAWAPLRSLMETLRLLPSLPGGSEGSSRSVSMSDRRAAQAVSGVVSDRVED